MADPSSTFSDSAFDVESGDPQKVEEEWPTNRELGGLLCSIEVSEHRSERAVDVSVRARRRFPF
jgi:hypothetical protein